MNMLFFCPRWGSEHLSWDAFCRQVKEVGYDGVEAAIPFDEAEKAEIKKALEQENLLLIGQYYQSFEKDFSVNIENYERHLRNIAGMRPVKIDAQTGKDYFSPQQNDDLFVLAQQIQLETGISICHETHRNKALFAAHATAAYLKTNPALHITADFSHWCCVAESLLEDQQEAVSIACERARHIHARVGYAEGPQVNDPRAAEWANEVEAHLQWWDVIVQHRKNAGDKQFTITPEFGPAPYMPATPHTQQPLANQWEVNVHMMQLLRNRYKN